MSRGSDYFRLVTDGDVAGLGCVGIRAARVSPTWKIRCTIPTRNMIDPRAIMIEPESRRARSAPSPGHSLTTPCQTFEFVSDAPSTTLSLYYHLGRCPLPFPLLLPSAVVTGRPDESKWGSDAPGTVKTMPGEPPRCWVGMPATRRTRKSS